MPSPTQGQLGSSLSRTAGFHLGYITILYIFDDMLRAEVLLFTCQTARCHQLKSKFNIYTKILFYLKVRHVLLQFLFLNLFLHYLKTVLHLYYQYTMFNKFFRLTDIMIGVLFNVDHIFLFITRFLLTSHVASFLDLSYKKQVLEYFSTCSV